jgi:hypothetical protein
MARSSPWVFKKFGFFEIVGGTVCPPPVHRKLIHQAVWSRPFVAQVGARLAH